ncbi:unnamed protein product, partial [Ixodes hexagonus]
KLLETGAIWSPLYGHFPGDRQVRKLVYLSVSAGCSLLVLLALFPVLMRDVDTDRRRLDHIRGLRDNNVTSYSTDMRRSMNASHEDPCEDFYGFVCSRWPETHPNFEHQFHLADNRVKLATLRRLYSRAAALERVVNPTVAEKVDQALSLCLAEHVNHHEHADHVTLLLNSVGIDWPKLLKVSRRRTPFNFLETFLTFAQRKGLPVFFQFLPEADLRRLNSTVLTLSRGWLQQLSGEMSAADCAHLAKLYGRHDLTRRLVDVHQRVASLEAHFHESSMDETPKYVKVKSLATGNDEALPAARTLLEIINANFDEMNQVSLNDDVFVTDGGHSAWRLAATFSAEYGSDDAEAGAAYVSVLVLRKLAVQSSPLLTRSLGMSKYHCFEAVQDVAPHALALSMAESVDVMQDIPTVHFIMYHLRAAAELSFQDLTLTQRVTALKKLKEMDEIAVVPESLMDPAVLQRHYSHVPAFDGPFIASYLSAHETRASRAKATLGQPVMVNRLTSHRLLSQSRWPEFTRNAIHVPVTSLVHPIFVRDSLGASYAAVGHLIGRELVRALAGASSTELSWNSASRARLECLRRRGAGEALLDEIYADTMGLKVRKRAQQVTGCHE